MTATMVGGLAVIADEATEGPEIPGTGRRTRWEQTRTLLLEDGSEVYGCLHCDYTSPNVLSIRPHLNKHRDKRNGVARRKDAVSEALRQLQDMDALRKDRDAWRRRAVAAEATLKRARDALGVKT